MGIEMDYSMESPLEVLSRAALMVQNEEREAALKRSGESRQSTSPTNERTAYEQPCKRLRESPPAQQPSPPPYTAHHATSHMSSSHASTSSNIQPRAYSSAQTVFASQQGLSSPTNPMSSSPHYSAAASGNQRSSQSTSSHPHLSQPWQPFAANPMPHSQHKLASLPVNLYPVPRPEGTVAIDSSNVPLNLSVSHHEHSQSSPDQASLPSASVIAQSTLRAEDSSSPGVPENVAGRRVINHNGMVYCPTPVHGASLPNMEAKTHRNVDSDTCDPAIEEHFRRSLGSAYMECMSASSRASSASPRTPTPPGVQPANHAATTPHADNRVKLVSVSGTVDEHFAKALGKQTWKQIKYQSEESYANHSKSSDDNSVDEHFTKALGADTWQRIKQGHMTSSNLISGNVDGHAQLHNEVVSQNNRATYYRVAPTPIQ